MNREPPEHSTVVVATIVLLALAFAGYWIDAASLTSNRHLGAVLDWFTFAAVGVFLLGIGSYVWRRGARKRHREKAP